MPKIFIFVQTEFGSGDVGGMAIAEDGTPITGHLSSSKAWLRWDMGLTTKNYHDLYEKHYPDGYELVDLIDLGDKVLEHEGLAAAVELNLRKQEISDAY